MCAAVGSHCERRAPMATSLSSCSDKLSTFERVTDMKCVHYKLNKGTNLTPVILMLTINKIRIIRISENWTFIRISMENQRRMNYLDGFIQRFTLKFTYWSGHDGWKAAMFGLSVPGWNCDLRTTPCRRNSPVGNRHELFDKLKWLAIFSMSHILRCEMVIETPSQITVSIFSRISIPEFDLYLVWYDEPQISKLV